MECSILILHKRNDWSLKFQLCLMAVKTGSSSIKGKKKSNDGRGKLHKGGDLIEAIMASINTNKNSVRRWTVLFGNESGAA